jgi:hypothetical protein
MKAAYIMVLLGYFTHFPTLGTVALEGLFFLDTSWNAD